MGVACIGLLLLGFACVRFSKGGKEADLEPPAKDGPGADDLSLTCAQSVEICNGLDDNCNNKADEDACPPRCVGWTRKGRAYAFCEDAVTWVQAEILCRAFGMELAPIDDAEEDQWVIATTKNQLPGNDIWIGGSDREEEGVWRWTDGKVFWEAGKTLTYANWGNNQPDNHEQEEHCLHVWASETGVTAWNDYPCSRELAYLCRR
jgi:hypothetical protein